MSGYRVEPGAAHRIDEIHSYSEETWGEAQADAYVRGMFAKFEAIAARQVIWRPIPAEFGIDGFFCRYEKHFIYWKVLDDGSVGIAAVLHERMHLVGRLKEAFG